MTTTLALQVLAHLGRPVGSHFRCCGVLRSRPEHAEHIAGQLAEPTRPEIPAQGGPRR